MLEKVKKRLRRKNRVRLQINGASFRPRLSVFRSSTHIYVQLIDDKLGKTLAAASDLKLKKDSTQVEMAKKVGLDLAQKVNALKITEVVFDRNGFAYHGRVKALAETLREN
jgi:large subunit ribosomal protein L18